MACGRRQAQNVRARGCHAKVGAHLLRRLQEPAAVSAAGLSEIGSFSRATLSRLGRPGQTGDEHGSAERSSHLGRV